MVGATRFVSGGRGFGRSDAPTASSYDKTRDPKKARALSNPNLSPHLSFIDMGGHGYSTVRVSANT